MHADDVIGECVDKVWDSDEQFAAVVQEALESASGSYERAKERGFKGRNSAALPKWAYRRTKAAEGSRQANHDHSVEAGAYKRPDQGVCG